MRFLAKFTLPTLFNTNQRASLRFSPEYEVPARPFWLSISLPPQPTTATISRSPLPPCGLTKAPVTTLASSLGSRPTFVAVKPQVEKRKRHDSAGEESIDRDGHSRPGLPAKRRRVTKLSSASLLLAPASARPADAKFSPGQVIWADRMMRALITGEKSAEKAMKAQLNAVYDIEPAISVPTTIDIEAHPWVQAVKLGAEIAEEDFVFAPGMDGFASQKELGYVEVLWTKFRNVVARNEGLRKAVEMSGVEREESSVAGDKSESDFNSENENEVEVVEESSSGEEQSESSDED